MNTLQQLVIIAGPTASGKSDLALKLASKLNAVILNADSSQLYQDCPILTASPSQNDIKSCPHLLYNIIPLYETIKVSYWAELASKEIYKYTSQNKVVIMVGGSGFYISTLLKGLSPIPEPSLDIMQETTNLLQKVGLQELKKRLHNLDPISANKLNDTYRITRAYGVCLATGIPFSSWQNIPRKPYINNINTKIFKILPQRDKIYSNINNRFLKMIEAGALDEAQRVLSSHISPQHYKKVIGLTELIDFLTNKISKEEAINLSCQKSRNYAKRQYTWLKTQLSGITLTDNYLNEVINSLL